MKTKNKLYYLIIILLISSSVSMQGMFASKYSKKVQLNKKLLSQVAMQKSAQQWQNTQSHRDRLVCPGEQKKLFSTTPIQNAKPIGQGGVVDFIKSWLWKPVKASERALYSELRTKGLEGILHELLYPEHTKRVVDRAGLMRDVRIFDEEDRKKAEEKLNGIIELDESYKTFIMPEIDKYEDKKNLRTEESVLNTTLFSFYPHSIKSSYTFKGTILDEVLYKLFSGERATGFYTTLHNELNYIKLAQELINKGMQINPDNEKNYMLGYVKILMRAYKQLYKPKSFYHESLSFMDEHSFKQLFKELDPILEYLISDQKLKQELHHIQKERQEIEANPQGYRDKMKEEKKREEYISKKGQILQWEYIKQTGDWNRSTSSFDSEVKFDESEYQEWKKTGFLRGEREKWEERQRQQQYESSQDDFPHVSKEDKIKIKELTTHFNLPSDAPAKIIMQRVRAYQKKDHPDILEHRTDLSATEKDTKAKEFGE
ncbi:MAG TPA: hypothetical protein VLB80_00485, partial [Candidatus Babeliales bacterium]|nr:hypothetical protein [Candidatus Babeliales bacterium]